MKLVGTCLLLTFALSACLSNSDDGDGSDDGSGNGGSTDGSGDGGSSDANFGVAWKTTVTSGVAGGCLGPFNVNLVDQNGNVTTYPDGQENVELNTDSYNLNFYSDAQCSDSISSAYINAGTSASNDFYVQDFVIESTDVEVDFESSAITSPINILPLSSANENLALGITNSGSVGICSGPITFEIFNNQGVESEAIASVDLSIQTSSQTVQFYTDAACSETAESLSNDAADIFIQPNNEGVQLYYLETTDAPFTVSASSPIGTVGTTVSMSPGAPSSLVLSPGSGNQGDCIPVVLTFQDEYQNQTVLNASTGFSLILTGSGSYNSFSDGGCNNATNYIVGSAGASSVTFWVQDSAVESLYIEVDSNNVNSVEGEVEIGCSSSTNFFTGGIGC